ncbi:MAG: manganese catalase family protein, partial [Anaerotignum sp.]|nr:manganese catalase family protein [Anaerotignum sp.]
IFQYCFNYILILCHLQIYEDIAVEQKARSTYEYLIDLAEDPAVLAPPRFLREREIVHFQRFGEALDIARDYLNQQHYFFMQKNGCNTK